MSYKKTTIWKNPKEMHQAVNQPNGHIVLQSSSGPDVNIGTLHFACKEGDADAVRLLLQYGATPDLEMVPDSASVAPGTPIQFAATGLMMTLNPGQKPTKDNESRFLAVFKALLEVGVNPNQEMKSSENSMSMAKLIAKTTLLDCALLVGAFLIADLLVKYGAKSTGTFSRMLKSADKKRLDLIVKRYKDTTPPAPKCPCQSGKLHTECHGDKQVDHEYPENMLCPCMYKLGKTYGDCCKKRGHKYVFCDDLAVGKVRVVKDHLLINSMKTLVDMQVEANGGKPLPPDAPLFPGLNKDTARDIVGFGLEKAGAHPAYTFCGKYTGFQWNPQHNFMVDRGEAILRVKEWNEALERYIQEKSGDSDFDEQDVRHRFTATLCNRCNQCKTLEKMANSYKKCARCKKVVYCSKECQKDDWHGGHKQSCDPCGDLDTPYSTLFNYTKLGWGDFHDDEGDSDLSTMAKMMESFAQFLPKLW